MKRYGERDSIKDGVWICQPEGKERILAICEAQKIPVESLVRVYKFKTGWWR